MSSILNKMFRPFAFLLINLGFDLKKFLSFKFIIQYLKDKKNWIKQGGIITKSNMILFDYSTMLEIIKGTIFTDLLVAKFINAQIPSVTLIL